MRRTRSSVVCCRCYCFSFVFLFFVHIHFLLQNLVAACSALWRFLPSTSFWTSLALALLTAHYSLFTVVLSCLLPSVVLSFKFPSFLSRIRFSIPTSRRFSSNFANQRSPRAFRDMRNRHRTYIYTFLVHRFFFLFGGF